jgi:hypothetical protein
MKTAIRFGALALLFAALGLAGYGVFTGHLPGGMPLPGWFPGQVPREEPPAPAPIQAPVTPDLPAPELATETPPEPVAGTPIARLSGFERAVKAKHATGLAWEDAQQEMPLYEDDAVRTFERSSATIAFGRDDVVELDQNALVVIKPIEAPEAGQEEISLALLSPELADSLASRPAAEQTKAIAAAAAKRQIRIRTAAGPGGAGKARVAVRTLPDKSTSVAALAGNITLISPRGQTVTLKEKMVTKIDTAGAVMTPRLVPTAPNLAFPEDGASFSFLRKTPKVDLKWNPVERARTYRIVVANDRDFRRVFADERVEGTAMTLKNLQPATYYWRVRAQDADGFAGPYSAVRSVKAIFDDAPPPLAILAPAEMFVSPTPTVQLRGKTDKTARVKVNGQKVAVGADGAFTTVVNLKEGVNLVTVEAVDEAGNAEYGKRYITYKGAKRSAAASVSGDR